MFVKLIPDQIARHWEIIKYGLEQSLPPAVSQQSDRMNYILSSLLCGKLQCWASYSKEDNTIRLIGIVVTRILVDDVSGIRNLLMYAVYGYIPVSDDMWKSGFISLSRWARSKGCSYIVAYTSNEKIVNIARRFGADTEYTFISIPL